MKMKTRAAMEWIEKQIEIAKSNGDSMTQVKVSENGRLTEDIVADQFNRAGLETKIGDGVVYCTPRPKTGKG